VAAELAEKRRTTERERTADDGDADELCDTHGISGHGHRYSPSVFKKPDQRLNGD
jgi:hypothetical protein